ncbi:molybdate transport system regulatory protein [Desulfitispora alkaliphila]|uniref:winged helix-turn-helix domain-containing protein n=1 Tax=Desulfitispora alkaliphila TaxID=622674 RepID=UPI003D1C87F6
MEMRYRLWLENSQGDQLMGDGLLLLLTTIKKNGSINKAAQELGMSYRAAWSKLNRAEKRLGYLLVVRQSGGKDGGGTVMTPEGETLLKKYTELTKRAEIELARIFKETFS